MSSREFLTLGYRPFPGLDAPEAHASTAAFQHALAGLGASRLNVRAGRSVGAHLEGCLSPAFSPDGRGLAVLRSGQDGHMVEVHSAQGAVCSSAVFPLGTQVGAEAPSFA